jgi:hypothetical protein
VALKKTDFELSSGQIEAINRHFEAKVKAYRTSGEDGPGSIKVEFEWVPCEGRFVTAYFDGEISGCEIETGL